METKTTQQFVVQELNTTEEKEFADNIESMKQQQEQIKLKVGDILSYSWGYDQTNVDFFKVVGTTKCMVKLRRLKKIDNYDQASMTGKTMPSEEFDNEVVIKKKPYTFWGKPHVSMEYGSCSLWGGQPEAYSSYA